MTTAITAIALNDSIKIAQKEVKESLIVNRHPAGILFFIS